MVTLPLKGHPSSKFLSQTFSHCSPQQELDLRASAHHSLPGSDLMCFPRAGFKASCAASQGSRGGGSLLVPSSHLMPLAMSRQKPWRGEIGTHLWQFPLSPFGLSPFFFPLSPRTKKHSPPPPHHLPLPLSSTPERGHWSGSHALWENSLSEGLQVWLLRELQNILFLILKGI